MPLGRISLTIPQDLVAQADARAEQLGRSRSWLITEALRAYLGAAAAREPVATYAPVDLSVEITDARRRRVTAELALAPAERLRRAEALGTLAPTTRGSGLTLLGFDSYESYYEWKKRQALR